MHDPIAAGRSAASRAVAVEVAVTALLAVGVLLVMGPRPALAAAIGGAVMTAGNAFAASVALGGGIQRAGTAYARLLLGMLGKWVVVVAGFGFALAILHLPALPALSGLGASMLAYLLTSSRDAARTRQG